MSLTVEGQGVSLTVERQGVSLTVEKQGVSLTVEGQGVSLKEYSSLQENPYNVRYIHTVLIIHI